MDLERFSHFISRIYGTDDVELDCDRIQALLPAYVEAELAHEELDSLGPAIRTHLLQCPDCAETHDEMLHIATLEAGGELPSLDEALAMLTDLEATPEEADAGEPMLLTG